MRHRACLFVFLLWAWPAWSQGDDDLRNRASFHVEAVREVPNDWVTARFSALAEGQDPAAVASSVNAKMKHALAIAKSTKQVEIQSGAYVSQPVYDDARIVRWRARQELRVEADDVEPLAKLIGELQEESVLLEGIDFSVKRATRDALEDELIGEALAAFRRRADLVAKGMRASEWSLISLSIGGSGGAPRMAPMRADAEMLSMSKTAPPVFEAGTSELRVRVDGTVELE